MLRENTVFAQKIIDFYAEKGVECSVVDEHLSLLVTLSADGKNHEFRYGNRAFAGSSHWKKFYLVLEREWSNLKAAAAAPAAKNHLKYKYRGQDDSGEEVYVNI
ncbi:MAG: hypothetical protein Q7R35_05395 [Elusimicrobiota bacterium]|nr:hypothetical protein [Elusimicrobiota bacterium]